MCVTARTNWFRSLGCLLLVVSFAASCASESGADERAGAGADTGVGEGGAPRAGAGADAGSGGDDAFAAPEEEEFLVREVAATGNHVFVPNSGETSTTVARVDAEGLGVTPIEVGRHPTTVRAASVDGAGSIAWVLSEDPSSVAIVRSDEIGPDTDPGDGVHLMEVPQEVNSLALSPDGRHLLAYIDPDQPVPGGSSVASLQSAALLRVGDSRSADTVHRLSVSREIQEIEFTDDGAEAFVVGADGINHLVLGEVDSDRFVEPLDIDFSSGTFAPRDREVEAGPDGDWLVLRSSDVRGLALYRMPEEGEESGTLHRVDLPGVPTDIDLRQGTDGDLSVLAAVREADTVARVDVEAASQGDESAVTLVEVEDVAPGLTQLTPDRSRALLYTTRVAVPNLGILDFADDSVRTFQLRNRIRSVAVSPTNETAVVVHEKREGPPGEEASALEIFRHSHGLTLLDLESGYLRPLTLRSEPLDFVIAPTDQSAQLYTILQSDDPADQGVARVDLGSYRSEFYRLPREPNKIGRVGDKIFVGQASPQGRITFFDVATGDRQTISGYELNARID